MDDLKVENAPLNVIPVTEYDPFEAKFAASLYWLMFRATEDGEFENIPSQVTSPIQRDSEKRITVRPEVTEFLTNGEVYCKVCNSIFHSKVPVVGHWAILQTLSRHGFYVVEEGDIAVTDSALQQRKPFRKSTHLALMDCLMSAFSSQAVTVQQVVQSVSKFSSFSASKELPFDLEDALLLWMNKICAILNDDQLKKQKQHAEQLLQNQDKAKRFRFRRDQLQPKVQTEFPVMEDLLKDISDGQTLLGIIMFYHPTVINLEDIRFDKNLSTKDCVHNLDLFRSLCSQFMCTSVLALKLEDILYGPQAMKPNVIALLAEIFHKCEVESYSTENGVTENQTSKPEVHLHQLVANKENDMDNKSSSASVLNTDSSKSNEQEGLRELLTNKHERLGSSSKDRMEQVKSGIWKSQSDGQVNSNSASSFKSPFHLDFTVDDDMEQPPINGPDMKRDVRENVKEKENPFSGIFQRPVLAGDRKRSLPNMPGLEGSPRTTPRQEHSLLARRNKQKQRTLDLEEWDVQQEEVEELNMNDLQRSQSLTGLDKAKVEPRQSFHAWREDTGASLSDTNLASSRSERISIKFRPNLSTGAPQRGPEELNMSIKSSGSTATAHASRDSLSSNDSLNVKQHGDFILSGARDSCMSDISTKELNQFEEIEAAILAGRSVETPRTFAKPKNRLLKAAVSEEDEGELNTSVSSEDMNMFRLEVLQRLTEDKLRQIPDGAEMEDDDDPILLARNNAASGSGNLPDQRTRLEVQDAPTDVPIDQLSPITETAEPVVSNPNSVSSANSTAPSSPCSPLDVAPFMPAFFTTSPANTLDRNNQRLCLKGREDTEETLVGEEDDFPDDPETSATPRFKPRSRNESRDFLPQSKSFEHLARGSYTVGHVSVEYAKAAGLPVIGGGCSVTEAECSAVVSADPVFESGKRVFNEEFIGRPDSSTSSSVQQEPSEVFNNREFSQKQTDSRQDLSGIRPLVLSSGDVEPIGVIAEVLDGRRDSLESSPAHSPALALGKRDHAYEEAVMRSREMTAQESPSDVVIFERSLASFGAPDNNLHGPSNSQTRENAPCNSGDLPASNKAEAYVFDFNQVAIHHYKNGHTTQDFRTYKKSKQAVPPESKVPQGNLRVASFHEETANQGLHRSQHEAHFGTYNKQAGLPESKVPQANLPAASFHEETANQGLHRSQHESHFGTYNKQAGLPESKVPQANLLAASFHEETANQGLHRSQQEAYFGTYSKHSHFASQEQSRISHLRTSDTKEADSVDGRYRQRSSEDAPSGRVYAQGVRQSDGFSTFRKDTSSQQKIGATESDSSAHMLEMRRSDGFTTFRKGETTIASVTRGKKPDDHIADQFAGEDLCHARAQDGLQHFYSASASEHVDLRQAPPVYDITPRPLPSSGGETEIQTSPRGRQEELVRTSVPSNITRSRTFRKTPDGQIIKDHNIYANSSSASSASDNSKLAGQQTVITSIRGSPEGAGSDNPHRISWTDESEAGARLIREHNASGDRSESPTNRAGRRGSPRQSGRGSPGARISWLIAAKNGVGGQVMLNDKGCMQKDTGKKLSRSADDSSAYNSPHFMTTALVGSDTLNQGDEFPWRHEPPVYPGPHTPSRVGPHVSHTKERTPDMESETLLNGNVLTDASTFVNNDSKPPEDLLDARSTTSELDTRAGGSIRDRIAALSAAAGVSRLNVTANREQLQVDVTPGSELPRSNVTREEKQSNVANEKGVAFDVEFQKPAKPRPPSRVVSRFRTKDLEKKYKTTFCDSQTTNIREASAACNSESDHVNIKEIKILKNIELGAVKDKSLAFEVSFDDEPRSKRSKDEPVLLQSPFKALKTRSSRRNQQKSIVKPFEPQRSQDVGKSLICAQNGYWKEHSSKRTEYTDSVAVENTWGNVSSSEPDSQREDCIKLLERESFTVESVSQASEHPKVKALSELANKDGPGPDATLGGQQRSSDYEESKLQKRNTFTLDLVLQCTEDAHEQGLAMTKALNELTSNEGIQTTEAKGPTSHLQKRNTYTIDSMSRKGAPVVTLLKELAVEEGNKLSNSVLPNETPQKRGTFTLDSVSHSLQNASEEGVEVACVLNDLANREELKQREQKSDVDTSALSSEMSQKRGTFTLESVSREIDDAIEKYFPNEMAKEESTSDKKQEPSEKRSTYTLDSVSLSLQSGAQDGLPAAEVLSQLAKQCELQSVPPLSSQDSVQKRGTFTLDDVSQTLEEAQTKGLTAADVLSQLSKQEELQSLNMAGVEESVQRRGTFTLDSVSQTLDEAQQRGLPTVQALHQLSSEDERHIPDAASQEENPPQKRGTYTLDTVSHAIEEAVEMGIPVSVTLNQLAHEGKAQQHTLGHGYSDATADKVTCDQRIPSAFAQSPEHRDEIEASFEDALEQLEDCVTVRGEESFPSSSNRMRPFSETPGNRGTYDLDDVSSSLRDGTKVGIPVVETLDSLSKKSGISRDSDKRSHESEEKRGTYTLDEVSRSIEAASEQGIPVVEALQNFPKIKVTNHESVDAGESVGKRGTYTLDEVSKSLEHAKQTGIPVIEALESLSKEKRKSPLRLKMPDRGTYTLDDVSHTLEKAKQRGLPVVDALGHLTTSKDFLNRQTPDAVHRRQEKLVNRKTYALASPLETIGEGAKLRLYDGNQRKMMSPISFHMKSKEVSTSKANTTENKARGLGVVQKLDFLTSACELLLEANAKEIAKDQDRTESTRRNPTSDEDLRGPQGAVLGCGSDRSGGTEATLKQAQTERNTYPLETVSLTLDDAKAKGIPVVESLRNVTTAANTSTTQRTNRMRLNSKSDSELMSSGSEKERPERYTHSLENVSRTLEDAKKAGIPVIQALDQLTNDLAEFSLTAMSGSTPITQLAKDNRKRKRYSETAILRYQEQSPQPSPQGSPYPPPVRKAYSLDDVALAVKQAFQIGTSLTDLLDDMASENPAKLVSSSKDVRPRSVDSGFVSSFSDNDISSQSFESPSNRSKSYIFDSSSEDLNSAKVAASELKATSFNAEAISRSPSVSQGENRRTFTLDHGSGLSHGIPVIEVLEKLSNTGLETENSKQHEYHEDAKDTFKGSVLVSTSNPRRKKSPPKPKRQFFKKAKAPQSNSDSFVIEFFGSNSSELPITSKYQTINNKVEEIMDDIVSKTDNKDTSDTDNYRKVPLDKNPVDIELVPTRDPELAGLEPKTPLAAAGSTPSRGRATWRPSGTVLDKIACLMDAAEDCGISPTDVLNQVTDLPCDAEGEIEESQQDEAEEEQAVTSQLAYLRMQLDEKRRHIEAEKHRTQAEWEDQRRRLGQTAFWYVIGKAQGGQAGGERPGSEALHQDQAPTMQLHFQDKSGKSMAGFPDQPSPPIAWSSPANSPIPSSVPHPAPNSQQFETREFRLSEYPPENDLSTNPDVKRPSSQPVVEVSSRPTPISPRPSSHDPAASHHTAPTRKCWEVDVGQKATPPPLIRPETASMNLDTMHESVLRESGGTPEIEVENHSPFKKGLALFIGDDDSAGNQGLTPEQVRKREKFLRLRQKKQEEDRTRKEAELEKKRRREEKQREKEMLRRMEEEKLRQEEQERKKAEQELRLKDAQAARVPDSYATYRRAGPWQHAYNVNEDASSYIASSPSQPSSFAEFSGPQCYVKPSGKSNRKIIVNAISHVCLSGTVNQDQKERCLQAISESDGHHFMILFKDGLKFRGIYIHNLENDQLFKVFGIGPRVVTSKMLEFLYKYNSGGKEFTKIPSKTISLSVDGFAIQKSCWNTGKPVVASKTSSNLKRPPRPPQR